LEAINLNKDSTDSLVDHVEHSIGGFGGHAFRRATHVSMAAIPYLFYNNGEEISGYFSLTPNQFVSFICITLMLMEAFRLKSGIVIVGQRSYESQQISALAWGAFAVSLALLTAPNHGGEGLEAGAFGIPIIFGLTFVDPVMGEIKRKKRDMKLAIIVGLLVSYTIWVGCYYWIGTNLMAAHILAPLTVIGELPKTRLIDDNATMVFFPLTGAILLFPFL
tara:strand:- start:363 stop:1022 length:660 start_codon:yes stop_codon:yes gene_type:complete